MLGGAFLAVVAVGVLYPTALIALAALPLAVQPVRLVLTRHDPPSLVAALVATARLELVVAVLLTIGLVTDVREHRLRIGDRDVTLVAGPAGWGEASPLPGYACGDGPSRLAAEESACDGWPAAVRDTVPVNALVDNGPVDPGALAGFPAVKVKVGRTDPRTTSTSWRRCATRSAPTSRCASTPTAHGTSTRRRR